MDLLFIPLTIGLPAIDESLEKLLTAMETFPNVYFILFMDMLGSAGSGKESGVRYMGYGQGKEQGSGCLRAEGGTETE